MISYLFQQNRVILVDLFQKSIHKNADFPNRTTKFSKHFRRSLLTNPIGNQVIQRPFIGAWKVSFAGKWPFVVIFS